MSKDPRTTEQPQTPKKRRGPLARLRTFVRGRADDAPVPTREVARERIRSKPGFYASLTPEARAAIESDDAPATLGPPPSDG